MDEKGMDTVKLFKHYDSPEMKQLQKDKRINFFLSVIAIVILLAVAGYNIFAIRQNVLVYTGQKYVKENYQTVKGNIVEVWLSSDDEYYVTGYNGNDYKAHEKTYTVFYNYTIDGETFEGNTTIGSRIEEWHKGVVLPTTVWVNPSDHAVSFLEFDLHTGNTVFHMVIEAVVLVIVIALITALIKYIKSGCGEVEAKNKVLLKILNS